jgi:hypothetical protein
MKDNCKRTIGIIAKIMKHVFNVLFVIVIIYYGVTALFDLAIRPIGIGKFPRLFEQVRYDFDHRVKIDEGDPVKMSAEAVSVSIPELLDAYNENIMEADRTYTGKILRLSGTFISIGEGFKSNNYNEKSFYLNLGFDSYRYSNKVRVFLKKDDIPTLENLSIGQTVTIVGKCIGESVYVDIVDAFFESYSLSPKQINQAYRLEIFSGITDKVDVEGYGRLEYELYNIAGNTSDDFKQFIFEQYIPILENGYEEVAGTYNFDLNETNWNENNTGLSNNVKRMMSDHRSNLSIRLANYSRYTDFIFHCYTINEKYEYYKIRAFWK